MATLAAVTAKRGTGAVFALAAAAVGGDKFANTGREAVVIANGSGAPITVTFAEQVTVDGNAVAGLPVVVGAGEQRAVGPFPPSYTNPADGLLSMTYSEVTSLTVGVLQVLPL